MSDATAVGFTGLVDLASVAIGGRALGASDDFFAAADNLNQPGRGVFIEGRYTDRGKWMDGWESRRRRAPVRIMTCRRRCRPTRSISAPCATARSRLRARMRSSAP